jgi:hypothetical protein
MQAIAILTEKIEPVAGKERRIQNISASKASKQSGDTTVKNLARLAFWIHHQNITGDNYISSL